VAIEGVPDCGQGIGWALLSQPQLVSGVLVQWLTDPARAPSSAQLALGLQAIADQVAARPS
jgi:hypothetical protein